MKLGISLLVLLILAFVALGWFSSRSSTDDAEMTAVFENQVGASDRLRDLMGEAQAEAEIANAKSSETYKVIGAIVVSTLFAIIAIVIIFHRKRADERNWAFAILGTIAGYWLAG